MPSYDPARRLAAEFFGTAFLVASVVGSGIMAERLANGNDAVALLGNTFATAAMLVVLIAALGPVSRAHFNPAVTLAFAMRREIGIALAFGYVVAQFVGGIGGTWLAHAMFEEPLLQIAGHARTGPAQWLAEGVAAFGLVATILAALRFRPADVAWMVGLYIAAAYWFTASTGFANPAVTIARSLTDSFSGIRPVDAPGFVLAQLVGAAIATATMGWLLRPAAAGAGMAPGRSGEAAAE